MTRLPAFRFRAPATLTDAAAMLAESPADTMLVAGGTDLVPNMKRGQQTPRTVVALRQIPGLSGVRREDGGFTIGATTTLTSIVNDADIEGALPGLHRAAAQIATPHLRNMGTIGGNLCLDTRCTYYDQTEEWRRAIGYCMKKDGTTCWVATSSPRCLAVSSTDTAPMLLALDARVRLVSAAGVREIAVADLYNNDGMRYLTRRPDEILSEIRVPDRAGWKSSYSKIRRRGSFDFPVAAVAVALKINGSTVEDARIVLGAVASRPLVATKTMSVLIGHTLAADTITAAADAAYEIAKPMDNTDLELLWRKKVVRSLVARTLGEFEV